MFNQYRSFLMTTTETKNPAVGPILGMSLLLGFVFLLFFPSWVILKFYSSAEIFSYLDTPFPSDLVIFLGFSLLVASFLCGLIVGSSSKATSEQRVTMKISLIYTLVVVATVVVSYVLRQFVFFKYDWAIQNTIAAVMVGLVAVIATCFVMHSILKKQEFISTEQ